MKNTKDVITENYQLMFGDCLERMKEIPSGSVDLILTDPPYGTTQNKWDSVINLEDMWKEVWRVLKPNGACVLFQLNLTHQSLLQVKLSSISTSGFG